MKEFKMKQTTDDVRDVWEIVIIGWSRKWVLCFTPIWFRSIAIVCIFRICTLRMKTLPKNCYQSDKPKQKRKGQYYWLLVTTIVVDLSGPSLYSGSIMRQELQSNSQSSHQLVVRYHVSFRGAPMSNRCRRCDDPYEGISFGNHLVNHQPVSKWNYEGAGKFIWRTLMENLSVSNFDAFNNYVFCIRFRWQSRIQAILAQGVSSGFCMVLWRQKSKRWYIVELSFVRKMLHLPSLIFDAKTKEATGVSKAVYLQSGKESRTGSF